MDEEKKRGETEWPVGNNYKLWNDWNIQGAYGDASVKEFKEIQERVNKEEAQEIKQLNESDLLDEMNEE